MTESGGAPGARLPETTISVRAYFGRDAKLRHLRLLVAIEDAGQLSKAAALLHITQPALSKALSEIERSIGHPLFDRGPRGLVPNTRGAALIRAARNVLGELDRVSVELRDLVDRPGRVLMVGAMPTAGLAFLALVRDHTSRNATEKLPAPGDGNGQPAAAPAGGGNDSDMDMSGP